MDTSCRNAEATGLKWPDVDLDNLILKLHGKGGKDRLVPFSFELRRQLYRWKQLNRWDLVFSGQQGQRLGRRNMLRDVKLLCGRLGIIPPARTIHAFRHYAEYETMPNRDSETLRKPRESCGWSVVLLGSMRHSPVGF